MKIVRTKSNEFRMKKIDFSNTGSIPVRKKVRNYRMKKKDFANSRWIPSRGKMKSVRTKSNEFRMKYFNRMINKTIIKKISRLIVDCAESVYWWYKGCISCYNLQNMFWSIIT
ncbi:hypothetical protein BpHYR1_003209 [Brachionus plicatilis]|uniref:Uncharacterized protein n=1 Tax=Brachionus plicatilis TaxID=10195 RepID=A0A3M7SRH7_BRAPC|nr:hypothetical protein BpHYR1_003209 [Brachionus plicatilis]